MKRHIYAALLLAGLLAAAACDKEDPATDRPTTSREQEAPNNYRVEHPIDVWAQGTWVLFQDRTASVHLTPAMTATEWWKPDGAERGCHYCTTTLSEFRGKTKEITRDGAITYCPYADTLVIDKGRAKLLAYDGLTKNYTIGEDSVLNIDVTFCYTDTQNHEAYQSGEYWTRGMRCYPWGEDTMFVFNYLATLPPRMPWNDFRRSDWTAYALFVRCK